MADTSATYEPRTEPIEFDSFGGWVLRDAVDMRDESDLYAVARIAAEFVARTGFRNVFVVEVTSFVKGVQSLVGWTEYEPVWDTIVRDRQGNIVVRRRLEIRGTFD